MVKNSKQERKVLYIFGNQQEFGQILTNILASNPNIVFHQQFTSSTVRQKNASPVIGAPPEFEAVMMSYIIYTNPVDLVLPTGEAAPATNPIKANFKVN